jgi:hypothetical protein
VFAAIPCTNWSLFLHYQCGVGWGRPNTRSRHRCRWPSGVTRRGGLVVAKVTACQPLITWQGIRSRIGLSGFWFASRSIVTRDTSWLESG